MYVCRYRDVLAGTYQEQGWPQSAYGISKLGVTLVAPILQRDIDADTTRSDIIVNSVKLIPLLPQVET